MEDIEKKFKLTNYLKGAASVTVFPTSFNTEWRELIKEASIRGKLKSSSLEDAAKDIIKERRKGQEVFFVILLSLLVSLTVLALLDIHFWLYVLLTFYFLTLISPRLILWHIRSKGSST